MADAGFPPVARADARVLILGSLPGQRSLQQRQYYALPHNAFWKIMARIADAGPELPYALRTQQLIARRIALWDVCASACRPGSLDAAIVRASVVPNAFAEFFAEHRAIELIGFNGAKAAELYRRLVWPTLSPAARAIETLTLPSTSPAHAALTFDAKLARWAVIARSLG